MPGSPEILVVPFGSLQGRPWAEALHSTIIQAFKRKDIQAFPPSWTRLDPDPAIGIDRLAGELGPNGHLAALLIEGSPAGCGGFLPFRGNDWINKEKSVDVAPDDTATTQEHLRDLPQPAVPTEWEVCCFCVHPSHRKRGLSKLLLDDAMIAAIREKGGKRLASNFSEEEETGDFWPRLGFKPIPGATSILPKGFTHTVGMEGLRDDIHFQVAMKELL